MSGSVTPTTYTGMTVVTDGFKTVLELDYTNTTGVITFNGRNGLVTLLSGDVTAALGYTPVSSLSPALTGTPTAPTATLGTSTTQLATTAFVANSIGAISSGVSTFNTRSGAVTLLSSDVTTALGFTPASLVSPAFTGTPTAPTATTGTSTTQVATTAFVQTAVSAVVAGVASFNTRTGAVTLLGTDVTSALTYTPANIASPAFTGIPTAPTAPGGTNTTQLATTAFVANGLSTLAGQLQFNSALYASSGSFTVPTNITVVRVTVVGGGGGGFQTSTCCGIANSGGAGGYAMGLYGVTPGAVITVSVGSGGAGYNTSGTGGAGGAGGTSSFGGYISATGGGGGSFGATGSNGFGYSGNVRNASFAVGMWTGFDNTNGSTSPVSWGGNYAAGGRGVDSFIGSTSGGVGGIVFVEW